MFQSLKRPEKYCPEIWDWNFPTGVFPSRSLPPPMVNSPSLLFRLLHCKCSIPFEQKNPRKINVSFLHKLKPSWALKKTFCTPSVRKCICIWTTTSKKRKESRRKRRESKVRRKDRRKKDSLELIYWKEGRWSTDERILGFQPCRGTQSHCTPPSLCANEWISNPPNETSTSWWHCFM